MWESLADAVIRFKPSEYNPEEIRKHALEFDTERFKQKIKDFVEKSYQEYKKNYS
jgi:hypothetical protein